MSQSRAPKHFEIDSQQYGDTLVLKLSGEFDLSAGRHFERAIDPPASPASSIVIDLSEVTFIDSSGLRALLRVWEDTGTDGVRFAVMPGTEQVRHTMALTGVDKVLPIVEEPPPGTVPTFAAGD